MVTGQVHLSPGQRAPKLCPTVYRRIPGKWRHGLAMLGARCWEFWGRGLRRVRLEEMRAVVYMTLNSSLVSVMKQLLLEPLRPLQCLLKATCLHSIEFQNEEIKTPWARQLDFSLTQNVCLHATTCVQVSQEAPKATRSIAKTAQQTHMPIASSRGRQTLRRGGSSPALSLPLTFQVAYGIYCGGRVKSNFPVKT